MEETETQKNTKKSNGKRLSGVVVSASAKDTVTVSVIRYTKHPKYGKFMKRSKKYLAHDPGNTHEVGNRVVMEEVRPISKRKSFRII